MVPCPVLPPPPPPPHGMGPPPPPPIPHAFCTRHCSETYISILLHARRCSETHIFILLDEPSRRIRWVDRAKLWRMQILSSKNGSAQCTGHFNAQQMESYTYTYPCTYIFININSYICKKYIRIFTYSYMYISIYI